MALLGVDVGGTFTDLILANGETYIHKVPTTVEDPSIRVMNGVAIPFGGDHVGLRTFVREERVGGHGCTVRLYRAASAKCR